MKTPRANPRASAIALAIAVATIPPATAGDIYLTAGFGQSLLKAQHADNLWQQTGFDHFEDQKSNTWKLGVGLKLNRYLDTELDYRDLGKFNSMALYTTDNGIRGDYNSVTHRCDGPCNPTVAGWQSGSTQGMGLSLLLHPDWQLAPYLRAGTFYHASKFEVTQMFASNPHATQLVRSSDDSRGIPFSDHGFGLMYGVGIRWKFLELEYTRYPSAGGPVSPYQDISTVMLGIRWEL